MKEKDSTIRELVGVSKELVAVVNWLVQKIKSTEGFASLNPEYAGLEETLTGLSRRLEQL